MRLFKIYGIWPQADIHTHNFRKCSHASVGLVQARPNYEHNSYIPQTEQHEPEELICRMLPLVTHCHTHYHLHPFYLMLFKLKILVAKQHVDVHMSCKSS